MFLALIQTFYKLLKKEVQVMKQVIQYEFKEHTLMLQEVQLVMILELVPPQ